MKKYTRLLRSLAPCAADGSDTDFRWVADPDQAARIARYELSREIFLVADSLLADKPAQRELFRQEVASGKAYSGVFHPPGWPVDHYAVLSKFASPRHLKRFSLPPAVKIRSKFKPGNKSRKRRMKALGIRRIEASYDRFDMEHGPDALYELSVSRFDRYSLVQAVRDFEAWAKRSRYFSAKNQGGRPPSTLLHLAYFRFMKNQDSTKPGKWFSEAIKRPVLSAGLGPITRYGKEMYASSLGSKGVSASSWSEGVAQARKLVMPAAKLLAARYLRGK